VLLITCDDMLWPQVGSHLDPHLILKQVDSIDELLTATPAGQPAIVLWDARNQTEAAAALSRLQLHSTRFAVVALDDPGNAHAWSNPIVLRQVVAHLGVPIQPDNLRTALGSAQEEVSVRTALLGDGSAAPRAAPSEGRKIPWIPAAIIMGVLVAGAAAYLALRHGEPEMNPAPPAAPAQAPQQTANPPAAPEEKVDLIIEKARQAMLERHFIDPADGSALALYRNALRLEPQNGEAQQGLQRLAEILFARVQSALDERKIDVALQALETARGINPGDSRLSALDGRIAALRAEIGPAQILAAINAQNFDRAAQLIDDAARMKSLGNAKLAQLRDELRRRHDEADIANFVKLIDTRLQQDKLIEPRNDSATYYLNQARAAGASAAALQPQSLEINKRLAQTLHAAIDTRHFADADRLLADLHTFGVPAATIASLQHDLTVARNQQAAAREQPQYLELAQSRLAQGNVTEPDTDSALYYVNQLRAADPKNSALPRISGAVQAKILERARTALDAAQPDKAAALLQMAGGLGASADLDALNARLAQVKPAAAAGAVPEVVEASMARVKSIELTYPADALRKNVEGWVELSFEVTVEGKTAQIKVLNASPAGMFDSAATKAISRVRYKPMMQGGKPIAVSTKLRIAFRLSN
jgi:TonB family protein